MESGCCSSIWKAHCCSSTTGKCHCRSSTTGTVGVAVVLLEQWVSTYYCSTHFPHTTGAVGFHILLRHPLSIYYCNAHFPHTTGTVGVAYTTVSIYYRNSGLCSSTTGTPTFHVLLRHPLSIYYCDTHFAVVLLRKWVSSSTTATSGFA